MMNVGRTLYYHIFKIFGIPFERFLPSNLTSFYRYNGSLSSPPCQEVVTVMSRQSVGFVRSIAVGAAS